MRRRAELELLRAPNFAQVSLPRSDGSILSVIVWVDLDEDGRVVLNGAEGRTWVALLRRAPATTVTVWDRENPYEYVAIEGRLSGERHDGAGEHFEELVEKYRGERKPPPPGDRRVRLEIEPTRVRSYGRS